MHGASRAALVAGRQAFAATLASGADWFELAEDLFGITGALDSSASLRRALTDPSREGSAKSALAARLFEAKVGGAALSLLQTLVSQRWARDRDLTDSLEVLAVETVVSSAEAGSRLDSLEDELFRFGRVVAGDPALRAAVSDPARSSEDKAVLLSRLIQGRTQPETVRLVRQAVLHPRGRRFERVLEDYLAVAARRREQLTAVVTSAVPLDDARRDRLVRALSSIYDRAVLVNVVIDPDVLGGIRVQVGDEVVDGTILRRLDEARRKLAG